MLPTISHYITDLTQNSLNGGATLIEIEVGKSEVLTLTVQDNGKGEDREVLEKYAFSKIEQGQTRHLGLAYLKEATENGGRLNIDSAKGVGTKVKAEFPQGSIEIGPLGDAVATILPCDGVDLIFTIKSLDGTFTLDTQKENIELRDMPSTIKIIKDKINQKQKSILGGTTI